MKGVGPVMAQALLQHFTSFSSLEGAYHTLSPEDFEQELIECFSSPILPSSSSNSSIEGKKKRIISAPRVVKLLSATDFSLIRNFQALIALRKDINHIEPACAARFKKEGIVELAALSTGHFRYAGELLCAEEQLLGVSPSLALPLQALRRTYHTLDRIK